jgi:enamine deaminase RidA (YjgF/YER057c/UK114 family)
MYARGLSTRDIEALLADGTGKSLLSRTAVSEITERLWAEYQGFAGRELGTGLDPRVIVPEHAAWAGIPIRRQTEFLIAEKLKPALEAAGSSLEQSVKAQIYLANIADMPDCLDVWSRHYAGITCAITVVPTKSFATAGGIIEINLIALTNGATRRKGGDRRQHPRHGCFRTIPQGRGIPAGIVTVTGGVQRVGQVEPSFTLRQPRLATGRPPRL